MRLLSRLYLASLGALAAAGIAFSWQSGDRLALADTRTQADQASDSQADDGPSKLFFGAEACRRCHDGKPADQKPVLVCRGDEMKLWRQDKHREAYSVLFGDRAKQMGELMQLEGSVAIQKECLSCHGANVGDSPKDPDTFDLKEGVSCAICHGPFEEWVAAHAPPFQKRRDEWRQKSRSEKEEKFGMRDVWTPVKRAELCVSCHIGNHSEGKVITHAMYAAGHPPLPGIEGSTFCDEMPRHWQLLKEKSKEVQEILDKQELDKSRFENSRFVLISGMVAMRESFRLLAGEAADANRKWPELAQFDCQSCHHELQTPGLRQSRGLSGKPGRPRTPAWPTVLVRLALYHLGQNDQALADQLKVFQDAGDVQPFGKREQVSTVASQIVTWADRQCVSLERTPIDAAGARKLLLFLGRLGQEPIDYDSACQIAWVFQAIYNELAEVPTEDRHRVIAEIRSLKSRLAKLGSSSAGDSEAADLQMRNDFDPDQFRAEWNDLLRSFELPLPELGRP